MIGRQGDVGDYLFLIQKAEVEALAQADFVRAAQSALTEEGVDALAADVAAGRLDPYAAAARMLSACRDAQSV